ncbi:MAG: zinc-ribbon domain-containing protein [Solirubrobacteraceae bacterium]
MSRQRCELCGRWLRVVGSRHLARVHGMTLADYRRIVERDQAGPAGGQLPDGTPYFGKLGEMAYDPDTDLMQCHLCGKWLKWVGGMHLKYRHDGWTIADYRHAFGLSASQSTVAAHSRTLLRAHAIERLDRARLGSPLGDGGLQAKRWKSLAERRPELVSELHPDRNGDLDPTTLGVWSSERVWWRCRQCGCEWQTRVSGRAAYNSGCPACGPRAALKARHRDPAGSRAQRSLAALRPDLAAELHPDRNPGVNPQQLRVLSKQKVWWRCQECAHEWEAMIVNRQQGTGCPRCATTRRAATYQQNRSLKADGNPRPPCEQHTGAPQSN